MLRSDFALNSRLLNKHSFWKFLKPGELVNIDGEIGAETTLKSNSIEAETGLDPR